MQFEAYEFGDALETAVGQAVVGGRSNLGPNPPGLVPVALFFVPALVASALSGVNEEEE